MSQLIDTNVLAYKYNGVPLSEVIRIKDQSISSINALEFLENIEKKHNNKAPYHIPRVKSFTFNLIGPDFKQYIKAHGNRPFRKEYSDSLTFDFKRDYGSYALYNNESVAEAINGKFYDIYAASINYLPKLLYKQLMRKFEFLVENNLTCLPVEQNDILLGYDLLYAFVQKYSLKDDFRNCWNDILILSKSINSGHVLCSSDKLLNRFASDMFSIDIKKIDEVVIYDFTKKELSIPKNINKEESKGYINRGWDFKMRRGY